MKRLSTALDLHGYEYEAGVTRAARSTSKNKCVGEDTEAVDLIPGHLNTRSSIIDTASYSPYVSRSCADTARPPRL